MKELYIIKIGGETLNDPEALERCISTCAQSGKNIILVHGGGKKVSELATQLNIPQQMIEGRRITSPETMNLCTMVYAGFFNKNIVATFSKYDKKAAGISGADFNCILSEKRQHPTINYGMVGDVKHVDATVFEEFIEKKIVPVVCSVTLGTDGNLLNTNADTIASEIAKAMSTTHHAHLIYCFQKNGVLTDITDENSVLESISEKQFDEMKNTKQIADGMIPKLFTAYRVLRHGVEKVHIINSKHLQLLFDHKKTGTQIILH